MRARRAINFRIMISFKQYGFMKLTQRYFYCAAIANSYDVTEQQQKQHLDTLNLWFMLWCFVPVLQILHSISYINSTNIHEMKVSIHSTRRICLFVNGENFVTKKINEEIINEDVPCWVKKCLCVAKRARARCSVHQ